MGTTKIDVANALFAILSPFHLIGDGALRGVKHIYTEGCLDKIVLEFDTTSLLVKADENDDSVDFKVTETGDFGGADMVDASHLEPWNNFIGKPFGWGWVTVNQQGYCDGLLLSFEDITPRLMLNVIASSIEVGLIGWISN